MRLRIVALGHRMPDWVSAGVAEYAKRLPREHPLEVVEIKPEPRDRNKPVPQLLAAEAQRLDAATRGFDVVALDERGDAWTTRTLAQRLAAWRDRGSDVAFAIGSADGLDEAFKSRAAARVSLSAMTLPHGLVRVMIAEQIYRAFSLLANHPYHRE
jgi:23S rRNA (pseudouridine1915-N3)-methyltransferase